jgi:hypothetical protein
MNENVSNRRRFETGDEPEKMTTAPRNTDASKDPV